MHLSLCVSSIVAQCPVTAALRIPPARPLFDLGYGSPRYFATKRADQKSVAGAPIADRAASTVETTALHGNCMEFRPKKGKDNTFHPRVSTSRPVLHNPRLRIPRNSTIHARTLKTTLPIASCNESETPSWSPIREHRRTLRSSRYSQVTEFCEQRLLHRLNDRAQLPRPRDGWHLGAVGRCDVHTRQPYVAPRHVGATQC